MQTLEVLVLLFLLSHIPITIFVDSQAVLPKSWYPAWAQEMSVWYLETYRDPLMTHLPTWFKALVYSEVFLQLPFFFVGSYAYLARKNWIRIPVIIYGSFVVATMVPILAELATHRAPGYNPVVVTGFYLPYLLLPLLMVVTMAATPEPFTGSRERQGRKGSKAS